MEQQSRGSNRRQFNDLITAAPPDFDQSQGAVIKLYNGLRAPCLALLQIYLGAICGTKSLRTALVEFRLKHPRALRAIYITDQIFDMALLLLVIIVFMRGLGIVKW